MKGDGEGESMRGKRCWRGEMGGTEVRRRARVLVRRPCIVALLEF